MKIGVIADTHVPHKFDRLGERMLEALKGVDLIIHCGDLVEPVVLQELAKIAPVEAVMGNHDEDRFGPELPRKKILELAGYRIGVIHGDELDGLHVNKTQQFDLLSQIVVEPFNDDKPVDCILFGHGHRPLLESYRVIFRPGPNHIEKKVKKDVILFNPGKPVRGRHLSSMGFLHLGRDDIRVELKVFCYSRKD
ncbi:MAG: metallophosphoesterase family protein [Thermincolia bacterium]